MTLLPIKQPLEKNENFAKIPLCKEKPFVTDPEDGEVWEWEYKKKIRLLPHVH